MIESRGCIIGVKCTKDFVYFCRVSQDRNDFKVLWTSRLSVQESMVSMHNSMTAVMADVAKQQPRANKVAILKCTSRPQGSSVEAIKAEGFVQLCCEELQLGISLVAPQSLKKALDAGTKTWQEAAADRWNSKGTITYFSQGHNGAIAAAYKEAR